MPAPPLEQLRCVYMEETAGRRWKMGVPYILLEMAYRTGDFFVFVHRERDHGLNMNTSAHTVLCREAFQGMYPTMKQTVNQSQLVMQCADQFPPEVSCISFIF